jgi:hypothetical protein
MLLLLLLSSSLVIGRFLRVLLLLNQRRSPALRFQVSQCSTLSIMCDVASTAVFCCESTEGFPGTAYKFSFKPAVTIPVAPVITGIIIHVTFHTRCTYIYKLLYFSSFSAAFCVIFVSACIDCLIYQYSCFLFFILNYYI